MTFKKLSFSILLEKNTQMLPKIYNSIVYTLDIEVITHYYDKSLLSKFGASMVPTEVT